MLLGWPHHIWALARNIYLSCCLPLPCPCPAVEFPDFVEPAQRAALQGALGPLPNGAAPMGDEVCFLRMQPALCCCSAGWWLGCYQGAGMCHSVGGLYH